jgi:hypothetical protein
VNNGLQVLLIIRSGTHRLSTAEDNPDLSFIDSLEKLLTGFKGFALPDIADFRRFDSHQEEFSLHLLYAVKKKRITSWPAETSRLVKKHRASIAFGPVPIVGVVNAVDGQVEL